MVMSEAIPSGKMILDLEIIQNIRLNQRHFLLELASKEKLPELYPGQFVQVLVDNSPSTFLRRPFSIHKADYINNSISLLVQIKGEGTRHLSFLKKADSLNVLFPLGNHFSLPEKDNVLLIGGGCGVAPLLFLAQYLAEHNIHPKILTGWRNKEDIIELQEYRNFGEVLITTEDGSEGEKGLVVDHSILMKEKPGFSMIYCCGPDPMMKSVAKIARMHEIECEVSLENLMACGFGACLCCITPTLDGNKRVCVEGPVFNSKMLGW